MISRRLSDDDISEVVKVDCEIEWTPDRRRRALQPSNADLEGELIANYTAYINWDSSVGEIIEFMNEIDVPVEEVGLTTPVGEKELTRQPTQVPSMFKTFTPRPNPTPNPTMSPSLPLTTKPTSQWF